MDKIDLLKNQDRTLLFLWLVVLSHKLIIFSSAILNAFFSENFYHPVFSVFMLVCPDGFNELFACDFFSPQTSLVRTSSDFIDSSWNKFTGGIVRVLLYSFLELLLIVFLLKIVHSNIVSI